MLIYLTGRMLFCFDTFLYDRLGAGEQCPVSQAFSSDFSSSPRHSPHPTTNLLNRDASSLTGQHNYKAATEKRLLFSFYDIGNLNFETCSVNNPPYHATNYIHTYVGANILSTDPATSTLELG